jgi:hypothetical protein
MFGIKTMDYSIAEPFEVLNNAEIMAIGHFRRA